MLLDEDIKSESSSFVFEILENSEIEPKSKNIVEIIQIETIEDILNSDFMGI